MEIKIELPLPPSINQCYATNFQTKRRFKSKVYEEWIKNAHISLLTSSKYKILGNEWLQVKYTFYMPLRTKKGDIRKVDAENYIKPTSDFLGKTIQGFEDSKIKDYYISKEDSSERKAEIIIKELT